MKEKYCIKAKAGESVFDFCIEGTKEEIKEFKKNLEDERNKIQNE